MMLQDLIPTASQNIPVTGLSVDSRLIKPGYLFCALPGAHHDGRHYISQALSAGATAILAPQGTLLEKGQSAVLIEDPNPRKAFALASARFYARQPGHVAAVTGTNGKSSTVTFVRQIWQALGLNGASLGTLGIQADGIDLTGKLTTPDPAGLHEKLAELVDHAITHLAMEASSHGLDQYRLDGVRVQVGAFTNLSRDHLDYHGDMESYLAAKSRLFSEVLEEGATCVLNADIAEFTKLENIARQRGLNVISFGRKGQTIRLTAATPQAHGQDLSLEINGQTFSVHLPLAGDFQVENALCALGIVMAEGHAAPAVVALLSKLDGVPGRLELIGTGAQGGAVYVDYAHTPDALETVLKALRPHCSNRLHVVFGCGGDRDTGKRPEMGKVAQDLSDVAYVTDDNPRSEDPRLIRKAILDVCPKAFEIADRKACIEQAIAALEPGDILVIAGKGHETGQIIGDRILPFDDRQVAREVLS